MSLFDCQYDHSQKSARRLLHWKQSYMARAFSHHFYLSTNRCTNHLFLVRFAEFNCILIAIWKDEEHGDRIWSSSVPFASLGTHLEYASIHWTYTRAKAETDSKSVDSDAQDRPASPADLNEGSDTFSSSVKTEQPSMVSWPAIAFILSLQVLWCSLRSKTLVFHNVALGVDSPHDESGLDENAGQQTKWKLY